MAPYLYLPVVALIVVLVGGLLLALGAWRPPDPARKRLDRILGEVGLDRLAEEPAQEKRRRPVLRPVLAFLGQFALRRLTPASSLRQIDLDLDRAGRPFGGGIVEYLGVRLLLALSMAALGALLARGRPPGTVLALLLLCAALGWWLPAYWLRSRVKDWQQAIWRDFPDVLDLLALCVGAGQGLDAAIARVSEEWPGPLADQFQRMLSEVQLGESRREALLSLAQRIDIPEVTSFISVIVQAVRVGGSISELMFEQADDIRTVRRQRAEELSRQAGTKMLFPLVFFMFPALMAVVLGPAVPQLLETLGSF